MHHQALRWSEVSIIPLGGHSAMRIFSLALFVAMTAPTCAFQNAPPVIAPERQFDFWIGEWSAVGKQRASPSAKVWTETKCVNSIRAVLDGNVIEENFEGGGLKGISHSVYISGERKWKQTWVDNQRSYLDFTGTFADGKMTLFRQFIVGGKVRRQRMVFHDIEKDRFLWDWEVSQDGKNWNLMWRLNYSRNPKVEE